MAKKLYDLAVKIGEYEKDGGTKGRYKNIGAVFEGNDGKGAYMLLDSTCISMQLFALVNNDRRDSVIVSMFDGSKEGGAPKSSASAKDDFNDPIPF